MAAARSMLPRLLTPVIREAMADTPVICLLGPRQSGKTTLVRQLEPERAYVSLDDNNYYQTATSDPAEFMVSLPDVVTLDEVQRAPMLLSDPKRKRLIKSPKLHLVDSGLAATLAGLSAEDWLGKRETPARGAGQRTLEAVSNALLRNSNDKKYSSNSCKTT